MKRRGPYMEYLRNPELSVPYMTTYNRKRKLQGFLNEQHVAECSNEINEHLQSESDTSGVRNELTENFRADEESNDNINNEVYENQFSQDAEDQVDDEIQNDLADITEPNFEQEERRAPTIDDNEDHDSERKPIYPGASLTKEESDLLIMGFVIRHALTDVALDHLLELLNCHLPVTLNPTRYKFLKGFPAIAKTETFYKCCNCSSLLDFDNKKYTTCDSCGKLSLLNSVQRNGHAFMYVPLRNQLQELLSSPLFYDLKRDPDNPDVLSDVTSGRFHRLLRRNGTISNLDISIQFNADGVQTFKSSRVSMCPVQVCINELEYRKRKDNILLAGLWASEEPPNLNIFLKPFVDELRDMHENGIQCLPPGYDEPVTIKVHTILAPVDSKERCALQNIHQYNGVCGCSQCLNEGERVPFGNGFTRVYRGTQYEMRTEEQHRRDALTAENEERVVNGVKGVSLLLLVPILCIIKSFPPEYMHSVLLGVVKTFLSIWLDSKYQNEPWYIGKHSQILDGRLKKIMPPCELTRIPQSVLKLALWKASEFRNFVLYYSLPCLRDLLPAKYYKHWFLLVYAINSLNKDKIDMCDLKNASKALNQFVNDVEKLYGKEHLKFNVHLLLHIPKSVQDFGALWAWSAFPYESYNFVLRNMLHNSQAVVQQICKAYLRYQSVKSRDTFSKRDCCKRGRILYLKMFHKYEKRTGLRIQTDDSLILYGNGKVYAMNLVTKLSVEALVQNNVQDNVTSYDRFLLGKMLCHSTSYKKMYKRNNSIVQTASGTFMAIENIIRVTTFNGTTNYVIVGKAFVILEETLCSSRGFKSSQFYSVRATSNILCCFPHQVVYKCVFVPCNDERYIVGLVNKSEVE